MFNKTVQVALTTIVLAVVFQSQAMKQPSFNSVTTKDLGTIGATGVTAGLSGQPGGLPVPAINQQLMLTYIPSAGKYAGIKQRLVIATYDVNNLPAEAQGTAIQTWADTAKAAGNKVIVALLGSSQSGNFWQTYGYTVPVFTGGIVNPSTLYAIGYSIKANGDFMIYLPLGSTSSEGISGSMWLLGK